MVKVQDFRHPKHQWNSGIIRHRKGPFTYTVQVGQRQVSVHVDHLMWCDVSTTEMGRSASTQITLLQLAVVRRLTLQNNLALH